MNERDRHLSPEERAVRDTLRELGPVEANPVFAALLRERFVSGSIAVDLTPDPEATRKTLPPRRLMSPLRLAAAIALLLALTSSVFLLNRGPRPRIHAAADAGSILVDGRRLDTGDRASVEAALRPGAILEISADGWLDLELRDLAVYELAGGTRMSLPAAPGRWFGRASACSLSTGELRFRSLPGFAGAEWTVHTPDGQVRITGTLLSVQCDESGTCVCVLEGSVRVGVDEADLELVPPGSRKVMPRGGEAFIDPVKPMHRDGVLEFDERIR